METAQDGGCELPETVAPQDATQAPNEDEDDHLRIQAAVDETNDEDTQEAHYPDTCNASCGLITDDSVVPLTLETGQKVDCKIDTGADVSLMPEQVLCELSPELKKHIKPCNTVLKAFNKTPIKVSGQIILECVHGNIKKSVRFIVVPHDATPLLSNTDAVALGYIKFLKTHIVQACRLTNCSQHHICYSHSK